MKKWMTLFFAGILASSVMLGCSKPDEGTTTPPVDGAKAPTAQEPATPDAAVPPATDDAAAPPADGATPPADGATPPAAPPAAGG